MKIERWQLRARQAQPLEIKIRMTQQRIRQWYEHWNGDVYVAFSGGKDSRVLAHIVQDMYSDVPLVFNDTGCEYPEIRRFVKSHDGVIFLRPKLTYRQVIEKYGYPVISKEVSQKIYDIRNTKSDKLRHKRLHGANDKYRSGKLPNKWMYLLDAPFKISHYCCDALKKRPAHKYQKTTNRVPILGTMTEDSHLRRQSYLRYGCNAFSLNTPRSTPMAFWTTDDVWSYIREFDVPYCEIYDIPGITRTGCIFCAFGAHRATPNKFQIMARTHPKLYRHCMDKLGMKEVLKFIGIPVGSEV